MTICIYSICLEFKTRLFAFVAFLLFIHQQEWKSVTGPIFWLIITYSPRFCRACMLVLRMINTFVIRGAVSVPGQTIQMESRRVTSLMDLWGLLTDPGGEQASTAKEIQNKTQTGCPPRTPHPSSLSSSPRLHSFAEWRSFVFDHMREVCVCGVCCQHKSFIFINRYGVEMRGQPCHQNPNGAYLSSRAAHLCCQTSFERGQMDMKV